MEHNEKKNALVKLSKLISSNCHTSHHNSLLLIIETLRLISIP